MSDYKHGLAKGVVMSDDEVLRFVNGMYAALWTTKLTSVTRVTDAKIARQMITSTMDHLAKEGMIATVGYMGTPIINGIETKFSDSSYTDYLRTLGVSI